MNLKDKVVVITGASSGIGEELARQFSAKGSKVVLAARNAAALEKHARAIWLKGGSALVVPTDVTSRIHVETLAERTFSEYGRLDIFIANAGISPASGVFMSNSESDVRSTMETNFMGCVYSTWASVPYLEKTGGGQLVFVSSVIGKRGVALNAAYCASKFAVQGLAESIRPELALKKINVMTVCPPGVDTPFYPNNGKGMKRTFRVHPVDKIGRIIVRACEQEKREVLPTMDAKILHYGNVMFPRLMDWAIARNKRVKSGGG
jgi:NAD(P)-dependent dehydrogenase (short-subunit alcohol dehydrogenase family)